MKGVVLHISLSPLLSHKPKANKIYGSIYMEKEVILTASGIPGCGKTTLLNKIAKDLTSNGYNVEDIENHSLKVKFIERNKM